MIELGTHDELMARKGVPYMFDLQAQRLTFEGEEGVRYDVLSLIAAARHRAAPLDDLPPGLSSMCGVQACYPTNRSTRGGVRLSQLAAPAGRAARALFMLLGEGVWK